MSASLSPRRAARQHAASTWHHAPRWADTAACHARAIKALADRACVRSHAPPQTAPCSRLAQSEAAVELSEAACVHSRPVVSEAVTARPCFVASAPVRPPRHRFSHIVAPPYSPPSAAAFLPIVAALTTSVLRVGQGSRYVAADRAGARRLPQAPSPLLHSPVQPPRLLPVSLPHATGPQWAARALCKPAASVLGHRRIRPIGL
jgi:hypothetical protein